MFLKQVKVKAFAEGVSQYGTLPSEWQKYRHCKYRTLRRIDNRRPEDIYTVIGKTSIKEGYSDYISYEEGNAFIQMKSHSVYVVSKSIGRKFYVLPEDVEEIDS